MRDGPIIKRRRPSDARGQESPSPPDSAAVPTPVAAPVAAKTKSGSPLVTVLLSGIIALVIPTLGYLAYTRGHLNRLFAAQPLPAEVVHPTPATTMAVLPPAQDVELPIKPQPVVVDEKEIAAAVRSIAVNLLRADGAVQDIRQSRRAIGEFETHGLDAAADAARDDISSKQLVLKELKRKCLVEAGVIIESARLNVVEVEKILTVQRTVGQKEGRVELESAASFMLQAIKSASAGGSGALNAKFDKVFPKE